MSAIELRELSFRYDDGARSRKVLEQIELNIRDGEFLCVIGASGCGKSTLLRILAGLEKPEQGQVLVDGQTVTGPGTDRMIVFQDYALFPWMKAIRNISFAVKRARHVSTAEADRIAEEFLEKVEMRDSAMLYPYQLSGGMKQRIAIARALAMDTDILLLDEPFGALDAKIRRQLQDLLLTLWMNEGKTKKTVVFVTHDINEAVLLADRVIYMKPGRIERELAIDLPRPRSKHEEGFERYREELLRLFGQSEPEVTGSET